LTGNEAANTLDGGAGDDTYVIGTGDIVVEASNRGIDTVLSGIAYILAANVENLTLTGADALKGTGNSFNNILTGNSAANILDGSSGADTLIGGLDNDTYIVDNIGDVVTETSLLGTETDTVLSTITYTLGSNVENLTLAGTSAINGTGNSLNNILTGNTGNNVLTGGVGSDLLNGDLGADALVGDIGNDILQGGAGNDTLSDTSGANLLDGGSGSDTLTGNDSNEMFVGGAGSDIITTGNGADIIAFNRGDGMDVINGGVGTDNTLSLGGGIPYSDLAFSKVGDDLIVEVGNSDQLKLSGWYDVTANHKSVLNLQIFADTMAGFDRASGDPLLNKSIQNFDFIAIVNAFDQTRGGANLMHWNTGGSLLAAHLSASDNEALGGDLTNQYGQNGNFSNLSLTAAQDVLGNPSFGLNPQVLHDSSALNGGMVWLV
jgi:Ca2+-binding RTX toxin-like protein